MQGLISSVGNIDTGGQGGDVERYLKIVFDLSNITPVPYGDPPNVRYMYSYAGYPSCSTIDSLGNEEAESMANVLHYYLMPIASNDEDNTGVTCEFDGLMCEGVIRSANSNLQSATFYFLWYVDLEQDYVIIKNNLTYREPQPAPEPEVEKYIKVLIDLAGITPTTEVVDGKTYNKFIFTPNELDVLTYSNNGPTEAIPLADMRDFVTMPISNNNNDMGLYVSYDGTTFVGYVLSLSTTLTEVTFMFDFYQIVGSTSFTWKNYVDMVAGAGESSLQLTKLRKQYTNDSYFPTSYVQEFFIEIPSNVHTISDLKNYIINNGAYSVYNAQSNNFSSQTAYIPCCFAKKTAGAQDNDCGNIIFVKRYSKYGASTLAGNNWNSWDDSNITLTVIHGAGSTATYTVTIDDTWVIV